MNRVPLEIISKVILRHQDLKTIQVCHFSCQSEYFSCKWIRFSFHKLSTVVDDVEKNDVFPSGRKMHDAAFVVQKQ